MNSILEQYRLHNPNDDSSDDYLTWKIGSTLRQKGMELDEFPDDFKDDFLRIDRSMRPGKIEEFKQGFARGTDTLQGTLYGAVGLLGDVTGVDAVKDFGTKGYVRNMEEAQEHAPSVRSYKDVESVGDAMQFAFGLAGEAAPSLLESVGSGLIGAGVGTVAGGAPGGLGGAVVGFGSKSAIRGMIRNSLSKTMGKELADQIAKDSIKKAATKREVFTHLGKRLTDIGMEDGMEQATKLARRAARASASTRAVVADSIIQNTGATYGELSQEEVGRIDRITNALAGGTLAGALDAALPAIALNRLFGNKASAMKAMSKVEQSVFGKPGSLRNFFSIALKDIGVEGTTEAFQELIQEVAVQRGVHGSIEGALAAIDPEELKERMINAALAGMAGGGMIGVPSAGVTTIQNRRKTIKPVDPETELEEHRGALDESIEIIHRKEMEEELREATEGEGLEGTGLEPPEPPITSAELREEAADLTLMQEEDDEEIGADERPGLITGQVIPEKTKDKGKLTVEDLFRLKGRKAALAAHKGKRRSRLTYERMQKGVDRVREEQGDKAADAYEDGYMEVIAQIEAEEAQRQAASIQEEVEPDDNYTIKTKGFKDGYEQKQPDAGELGRNEIYTRAYKRGQDVRRKENLERKQAKQESEAQGETTIPKQQAGPSAQPAKKQPAQRNIAPPPIQAGDEVNETDLTNEVDDDTEVYTTDQLEARDEGELLNKINNFGRKRNTDRPAMVRAMHRHEFLTSDGEFTLESIPANKRTVAQKAVALVINKAALRWPKNAQKILEREGLIKTAEAAQIIKELKEIHSRYVGGTTLKTDSRNAVALRAPDGKIHLLGTYYDRGIYRVVNPQTKQKYVPFATDADGMLPNWEGWEVVGYAHFPKTPSKTHAYTFSSIDSFREKALTSDTFAEVKETQKEVRAQKKRTYSGIIKDALLKHFSNLDARVTFENMKAGSNLDERMGIFRDALIEVAGMPERDATREAASLQDQLESLTLQQVSMDALSVDAATAQQAALDNRDDFDPSAVDDTGEGELAGQQELTLDDIEGRAADSLQELWNFIVEDIGGLTDLEDLTLEEFIDPIQEWAKANDADYKFIIATLREYGKIDSLDPAKAAEYLGGLFNEAAAKEDPRIFTETIAGRKPATPRRDARIQGRPAQAEARRQAGVDREGPARSGSPVQKDKATPKPAVNIVAKDKNEEVKPDAEDKERRAAEKRATRQQEIDFAEETEKQTSIPKKGKRKPAVGENRDGPEAGDPPMESTFTPEGIAKETARAAKAKEAVESGDKDKIDEAGISPENQITIQIMKAFPGVSDQGLAFLRKFFEHLYKNNPDAMSTFTLHIGEGKESMPRGMQDVVPENRAGAFDAGIQANNMWLNSSHDRNQGEGIVLTILHEAGHLATNFMIDQVALAEIWMKMSNRQRADAWSKYTGKPVSEKRGEQLKDVFTNQNARTAMEEWAADLFLEIAFEVMMDPNTAGKDAAKRGIPEAIIQEFIKFAEWLHDIFLDYMGVERDARVDEMFREVLTKRPDERERTVRRIDGSNIYMFGGFNGAGIRTIQSVFLAPERDGVDASPNLTYRNTNGQVQGSPAKSSKERRQNLASAIRRQWSGFIPSGSREASVGKRSETALVLWARKNGLEIDGQSLQSRREIDGGSEHSVYYDRESGRVVKITHAYEQEGHRGYFGSVHPNALSYIENVILINHVFGDDIGIEGVVVENGLSQIVISQPYIPGLTLLDDEEGRRLVYQFMEEQGFTISDEMWRHPDGWEVFDTHPGNFIKVPGASQFRAMGKPVPANAGRLVPIDIQIRHKDGNEAVIKELIEEDDQNQIFLAPERTFERNIRQGMSRLSGYEDPKRYLDHARMAWEQTMEVTTQAWRSVVNRLRSAGVTTAPYSVAQFSEWFGNPERMQQFIQQQAGNHDVDLDDNTYESLEGEEKRVVSFIIAEHLQTIRDDIIQRKQRAELRYARTMQNFEAMAARAESQPQSMTDRDLASLRELRRQVEQVWPAKIRMLNESLKAVYHHSKTYVGDLEGSHLYNIGKGTHLAVPENADDERPASVEYTWENGEFVLGEREADILRKQWDWLHNPENKARDPFLWNTIKAQYVALAKMAQQKGASQSQNILFGWFRPIAQRLKDLAHPAATDAARQQFLFESIYESNLQEATRLGQRSDDLRMQAVNALGLKGEFHWWETFTDVFDTPLKRYFEQHGATFDGAIRKLMSRPEAAEYLRGNDVAIAALRRYIESERQSSQFFRGLMRNYSSITDSRIQMPDPNHPDFDPENPWATTKAIERPPLDLGEGTFMLTPDVDYVRGFVDLMLTDDGNILNTINLELLDESSDSFDPEAVYAQLGEIFSNNEIRERFLEALIHTEKSPFFVDRYEEFLSPELIRSVWTAANQDPATFFRMISENDPITLRNNLTSMKQILGEAIGMVTKEDSRTTMMRDGAPHISIDARQRDRMPSDWLSYRQFGATANRHLLGNAAFQSSYGKGGELFYERTKATKEYYSNARQEFKRLAKLQRVRRATGAERKRAMLDAVKPEFKEVLQKALQGKALPWLPGRDVNPIKFAESRIKEIKKIESAFAGTFASELGPIKEASTFLEFVQLLAQGTLNGPRSAFVQFNSIYFPTLFYGRSGTAIKQIWESGKFTVQTIFGSAMAAFGLEMNYGRDMQLYERLIRIRGETADKGLGVRDIYRQLRSDVGPKGSMAEDRFRRGMRTVSGMLNRGVSHTKGTAYFPSFNPFAPFRTAISGIKDGAILSTWKSFDTLAARAIQYVEQHSDLPASDPASPFHPEFKFTAEMLGYNSKFAGLVQENHAFAAMNKFLNEEVGTSLEQVAISNATGRIDPDQVGAFTDLQYAQIAQVALSYITSESSFFTTRPDWMKSSYMGRIASPLLGWTMQQPNNFAKMFKDPETHKVTYQTIGNGLLTFAMMALPFTLAFSLFMDWFDEGILGKKSAMRKITPDAGLGENALAMSERFSRWGPMGLPAEAGNLLFNVGGGGGDLRDLSLDSRILFANSVRGILGAVGTYVNQGSLVPSYASVVRPMAMSLGMNGPLQVTQMVSNMTGLDNRETRVNRRTNANNWLRSSGRILDLEVRSFGGGGYTPTPMTPQVTQMILAAMANDREEFREAYKKAIRAARKMGKDDPEDAVKRSFQGRHPLKSIFKTPPTPAELQKMYDVMGEGGAQDVQEAIRLYNAYGQVLGINPYHGKVLRNNSIFPTIKPPSQRVSPFAVVNQTINPYMP